MVLLAFLAGLAVVILATIFCVVRGLGFWRRMKRTRRAFSAEMALFDERSARTEKLLADSGLTPDEQSVLGKVLDEMEPPARR